MYPGPSKKGRRNLCRYFGGVTIIRSFLFREEAYTKIAKRGKRKTTAAHAL
jgi:hypothetical protein